MNLRRKTVEGKWQFGANDPYWQRTADELLRQIAEGRIEPGFGILLADLQAAVSAYRQMPEARMPNNATPIVLGAIETRLLALKESGAS